MKTNRRMRIRKIIKLVPDPLNTLQGFVIGDRIRGKPIKKPVWLIQRRAFFSLEPVHERRAVGCILSQLVIQLTLKITGNLYIHRSAIR